MSGKSPGVRLRVGCSFDWEVEVPTAAVVHVEPRTDMGYGIVFESWASDPEISSREYVDAYGNRCRRLVFPEGKFSFTFAAEVDVDDSPDESDESVGEIAPDDLPDDVLVYTLPSRYCLSDVLYQTAWDQFGSVPPGWGRVQAVIDFVHGHLEFGYGSSTAITTAVDVYEARAGVCRDYAHLAVTLLRALNIPARYAYGYLPDVGVAPLEIPMDFYAWVEVFLGGRWWTFDPRNNRRRIGRVLIGRGRDAVDVAMVTTFGGPTLSGFAVVAEPAETTVVDEGASL